MAEMQREVLQGPYDSLAEPSVRCFDDPLYGGQNDTVGTVSAHRSTDPDGLVAQTRTVRRRYPREQLEGWPCDVGRACKQVAGDSSMIRWVIIILSLPAVRRKKVHR